MIKIYSFYKFLWISFHTLILQKLDFTYSQLYETVFLKDSVFSMINDDDNGTNYVFILMLHC